MTTLNLETRMDAMRNPLTLLLLLAAAGCTAVPVTPAFAPRSFAVEGEARAALPEALTTPLLVDDAWFEVVEMGRGAPVVLVPADPEMGPAPELLALMEALAAHHHVVAYTVRRREPGSVAAEREADELTWLLERLGTGAVHLIAHGGGAHAAIWLALEHPERVRSLVLTGEGSGARAPYATADRGLRGATDGHVWEEIQSGAVEPSPGVVITLTDWRPHLPPARYGLVDEPFGCNADELLRHLAGAGADRPEAGGPRRRLTVPTLVARSDVPKTATLLSFLAGEGRPGDDR
jgi:pimeloyl-ACP methyl ester carboxylesterase